MSRSTLYDWKKGGHLPEDAGALLAVVELCLDLVSERDLVAGGIPGDAGEWLALLAEAKQARDARGGGMVPGHAAGSARFIGMWDPVVLGVHRAIRGGPLPPYVRRAHDDLLYAALDPDIADNRLVVLRGGSSTGKSRAAYQALAARLPRWPLLYPRTAPALTRLLREGVASGTVLWLDELRHYADDPAGEEALFELGELVSGRGHIVVVTTVWPEYWAAYIADHHRGPGTADPFRAARGLLLPLQDLTGQDPRNIDVGHGGFLDVPEHFTSDDLARAHRRSDPVLREAAIAAERAGSAGQFTQYLAGIPALINHYQGSGADPYGHALITAAIDVARISRTNLYSRELLQDAAVGYLIPRHRASIGWQEAAWTYATRTLKGAIQALEPVAPEQGTGIAGYRLADYLDQHGRRARATLIPPAQFWQALGAHADPSELPALAYAAYSRGLFRHAAQLYKQAADHGFRGAESLIELLRRLHPADNRPASWAAEHSSLDNPWDVSNVLRQLREMGAAEQLAVLLARAPGHHAHVQNSVGVRTLLKELCKLGADGQVTVLADHAALFTPIDKPRDVASLLETLKEVGAARQALVLADRIAAEIPLDFPAAMRPLFNQLRTAGAVDQALMLADRVADETPLDQPGTVAGWLRTFREMGAPQQVLTLLNRNPAGRTSTDRGPVPTADLAYLVQELYEAGATDQVAALAARAAAHAPLTPPNHVADLINALERAGEAAHASALAARAARDTPLENAGDVQQLLRWLKPPAVTEMLNRSPGVSLQNGVSVAGLIRRLRETGAAEQLARLLDRDPAACVDLRPDHVDKLIQELRDAGADDQAGRLAARAAAHVPLDYPTLVGGLLRQLWEAGATQEAATLAARMADLAPFSNPPDVTGLINALLSIRAHEAVTTLLARDPASHTTLTHSGTTGILLDALHEAGATDQVALLAARAATHAPLDNPHALGRLLEALHKAGASEQVAVLASRIVTGPSAALTNSTQGLTSLLERMHEADIPEQIAALIDRLPAEGHFDVFARQGDNEERYWFGREPDGRPADPWGWDDLN